MDTSKTKVMVISKSDEDTRTRINVNGEELEQVSKYKYLGSIVTQNGKCVDEIKTRIAIAEAAFNKIKSLVTNR